MFAFVFERAFIAFKTSCECICICFFTNHPYGVVFPFQFVYPVYMYMYMHVTIEGQMEALKLIFKKKLSWPEWDLNIM